MRLVVLPVARADILRQFGYYDEAGGSHLAERFLVAVQQSMIALAETPNAGLPKHFDDLRLSGLRSWPIAGFEVMRAYYLVGQDQVMVLRLLHGRRDIERVFDADET